MFWFWTHRKIKFRRIVVVHGEKDVPAPEQIGAFPVYLWAHGVFVGVKKKDVEIGVIEQENDSSEFPLWHFGNMSNTRLTIGDKGRV
jgi:hypothetical protein